MTVLSLSLSARAAVSVHVWPLLVTYCCKQLAIFRRWVYFAACTHAISREQEAPAASCDSHPQLAYWLARCYHKDASSTSRMLLFCAFPRRRLVMSPGAIRRQAFRAGLPMHRRRLPCIFCFMAVAAWLDHQLDRSQLLAAFLLRVFSPTCVVKTKTTCSSARVCMW